ncbi:hypothetical protein PR001_g15437 [Phytophthora rubi]|uniref:DUF6818 domain-containing protein n=1 Tax=Phytophthora rubi TaxID=129364 RepID=A0A6A3LBA4_9STRA|nr:hypothetical protein PR001_g15437 [Phytophthora rubi]
MRQAGYHNYIDREELLLCDVAAKFVPIGWNMWESVAAEYNASKERSWAARDFDWLRRKFRKLYAKPKPTDYRVQSGAHTSHDGRVNGVDDTQLLEEVNSALNGEGGLIQLAQAGLGPIQSGDQNLGEQNDDDVSDASPDENFDIINSSYVGDSTGTVTTSQGLAPVEFAAESSDEETKEQDSQSIESSEVFTVAVSGEGPDG